MDYTQQDVEDNMGLVHFVAQSLSHKLQDNLIGYEDLVSDGTLGLIHALKRFDPDRGFKFSSYAYKCIWGCILKGNRDFYQERWKTRRPLIGNPEGTRAYTFSIHGKTGGGLDGLTWEEVIGEKDVVVGFYKEEDPATKLDSLDPDRLRQRMMEPLSPRQRAILGVILDNDLSQVETAKQFGVSKQAIHIQWKRILEKLQGFITPEMLAELT